MTNIIIFCIVKSPHSPVVSVSLMNITDVSIAWNGVACQPTQKADSSHSACTYSSVSRVRLDSTLKLESYNESSPTQFLDYLISNHSQFKAVNFIASHGKFIRMFVESVRQKNPALELDNIVSGLERHQDNNLFILGFKIDSKQFYLVRHCFRIYQKENKFLSLGKWLTFTKGERNTPDPDCKKFNGKICNEQEFKDNIKQLICRLIPVTVGVYSSCMNRATQTADVIVAALREIHIDAGNHISVLPYAREHQNMLGDYDVLNQCSDQTMKSLKESSEPACSYIST